MNNIADKLPSLQLNDISEIVENEDLEQILSLFDNALSLKVSLKNRETYYFERRLEGENKMSQIEQEEIGLKLYRLSACVRKPYGTEDFLEIKTDSLNGKIRFLIWVADIFYKYDAPVPNIIQQKISELIDDFDVVAIRHQTPSNFMPKGLLG